MLYAIKRVTSKVWLGTVLISITMVFAETLEPFRSSSYSSSVPLKFDQ